MLEPPVELDAGLWLVRLQGEVDMVVAGELREQLLNLIQAERHGLILDLSQVTFLDSTGLGLLVAARRRAQHHGGSLSLVGVPASVLKLFHVTRLHRVFQIYGDVDAALAAAECPPPR